MDIEFLFERSNIIRRTRAFFESREYLETDTPILSPDLIPESCLEVFKTEFIDAGSKDAARDFFLVPSPEIFIKKLIARYGSNLGRGIFQISKCFRNCEFTGNMHSPEFTMLEFYTLNADYLESLKITESLFDALLESSKKNNLLNAPLLKPPFIKMTMDEAFIRYAGFSLLQALRQGSLAENAKKAGIEPREAADDGEIFNLVFIHAVEPKLHGERPIALLDYPACVPCLAAPNADGLTLQRWELYVRGIETANCYSEETDPKAIKSYIESEGRLKLNAARVPHPLPPPPYPLSPIPYSGVAIGMDRFVMALCGLNDIQAVLPFPVFHK